MALTIILPPADEARIREAAEREGLPPERLAAQRLLEAELLWHIRTAMPERETRELHRLIRRGKAGSLAEAEQARLQEILDEREQRGAQRLQDLTQLSHLRSTPVRQLMEELGIRPMPAP